MSDRSTPPQRFDPWSGHGYGGARWFAASTLIHVGLLFAFATATLTVIQRTEEVAVSVIDDSAFGDDIFESGSTVDDLSGVLQMEKAQPQKAAPKGPSIRNVRAPVLPRPNLGSAGPKIGTNPDLPRVGAVAPGSFGSGAIGGLGGKFGEYVGGLRKVGLDVALVIDATSSMQFVIDDVRARLSELVATIHRLVPTARVGIVVYRDHDDEYVTKWTDLSFHTSKLHRFLENVSAAGGGDFEEAVFDALESATLDLSWRKRSKRVIILVGGSPPHAWDVDEIHDLAAGFAGDRGRLNSIDVTKQAHYRHDLAMWRAIHGRKPYEPSPLPDFHRATAASFRAIAKHGGGEMVELDEGKQLVRNVLQLTFGSRWKKEMAKFLDEL